jgi:trimeric autotransporter adhesin
LIINRNPKKFIALKIRLLISFLIIFIAFNIQKVKAQVTYTWNGGTSGSWTTPGNWLVGSTIPTSYPGLVSSDIAIINTSNATISISGNLQVAQLETVSYGTNGVTLSINSGNTLTISNGLSLVQGSGSGAITVLTFGGAGKYVVGGTTTPGYSDVIAISSNATVYFSSKLDMSTSQKGVTNAGTAIFLTGSSFVMNGTGNYFTNTGKVYSYGATFTLSANGNPGATLTNNGTFRDHGSTFSLTGENCTMVNTTSSANMYLSKSTINMGNTSGNNGNTLTNSSSALFTADSSTAINLISQSAAIINSSIFNAGITRTTTPYASPCVID